MHDGQHSSFCEECNQVKQRLIAPTRIEDHETLLIRKAIFSNADLIGSKSFDVLFSITGFDLDDVWFSSFLIDLEVWASERNVL